MRFEWAVSVQYENGTIKNYKFFTKTEAQEFITDMKKWKLTLGVKTFSTPIELHPKNAWVSPYILDKLIEAIQG